jgi:hypothetical protein
VLVLVLEARWPWQARPEYEYRFAEYEYLAPRDDSPK